ncbi:hypothetical protein Q1695_004060 [Nippostrongylus brasiliensis]|nr:hypothetical protein Q1695_004060 [Nippostrongylus brasiliensis]
MDDGEHVRGGFDASMNYPQYENAYKVVLNATAIEHGRRTFASLFTDLTYSERLRELSSDIYQHYNANRQITEEYNHKMASMYEVGRIIRKYRRWQFKLFPSGSTVTDLASKGSDLDATIWMPRARRYFQNESEAAFVILRNIRHYLLIDDEIRHKLASVVYVEAKVPVLKIKWKTGLDMDLSCCTEDFVSGIQNSYIIRGFSLWDWRFAPLCMFVKDWAAQCDVKSPKKGGFNSYAMVLLVTHFLQCAVFPPVLPNLQKLFPHKYARNENGTIRFPRVIDFDDRRSLTDFPGLEKNNLSLAELFVLFLEYYSRFNFGSHYICMRDATVKWRDGRDGTSKISDAISVFIRDPIDDHNPGRTVRDIDNVQNKLSWLAITYGGLLALLSNRTAFSFRKTLDMFTSEASPPTVQKIMKGDDGTLINSEKAGNANFTMAQQDQKIGNSIAKKRTEQQRLRRIIDEEEACLKDANQVQSHQHKTEAQQRQEEIEDLDGTVEVEIAEGNKGAVEERREVYVLGDDVQEARPAVQHHNQRREIDDRERRSIEREVRSQEGASTAIEPSGRHYKKHD